MCDKKVGGRGLEKEISSRRKGPDSQKLCLSFMWVFFYKK